MRYVEDSAAPARSWLGLDAGPPLIVVVDLPGCVHADGFSVGCEVAAGRQFHAEANGGHDGIPRGL